MSDPANDEETGGGLNPSRLFVLRPVATTLLMLAIVLLVIVKPF